MLSVVAPPQMTKLLFNKKDECLLLSFFPRSLNFFFKKISDSVIFLIENEFDNYFQLNRIFCFIKSCKVCLHARHKLSDFVMRLEFWRHSAATSHFKILVLQFFWYIFFSFSKFCECSVIVTRVASRPKIKFKSATNSKIAQLLSRV